MAKAPGIQAEISTTQYHAGRYYTRLISHHNDGYQYRYVTVNQPYVTVASGSLAWYGPMVHADATARAPRP